MISIQPRVPSHQKQHRLHAIIEWWATHDPEREAIVDDGGRITFAELAEDVRLWAGALREHGVQQGDRVATLAPPGGNGLVSLLATTSIGAIWSGLDPRLRLQELDQRLANLEPRVVFSVTDHNARSYEAELSAILDAHPCVKQLVTLGCEGSTASSGRRLALSSFLQKSSRASPCALLDTPQPAIIVYTSGSTGVPKGAMLHEAAILDFCEQQNRIWPVEPLRTLNFLPISHAGSIIDLTMPTLTAGGCVVFQRKFDPVESLRIIERERITFWGSVPSTFIMQLALPEFREAELRHVQLIAIEGAPIPEKLAEDLAHIAPIATNYGMTETCSAITAMRPTRSQSELTESVGTSLEGTELRIADPSPADGIGEILVRSPRNMIGYWRAPEATRDAFTDDGFFRTGDLGAIGADGNLRLAGRKKEMFISGGYNVYPAEIEAAISDVPQVETVAVVPAPHELWGEVGFAFFVCKPGYKPQVVADELRRRCAEKLADYKHPKKFIAIAELPLLPIGKVDRPRLRERARELS